MTFYIEISCQFCRMYVSKRSKFFQGIVTVKQLHSVFFQTFNSFFMRKIFSKKGRNKKRRFKIKLYKRNTDQQDSKMTEIPFILENRQDYYTLLYNNLEIKKLVLQPLVKCIEDFRTEIEEKYFKECVDIL